MQFAFSSGYPKYLLIYHLMFKGLAAHLEVVIPGPAQTAPDPGTGVDVTENVSTVIVTEKTLPVGTGTNLVSLTLDFYFCVE